MPLHSLLITGISVLGTFFKPESDPDPNANSADLRKPSRWRFKAIKNFDKIHMLRVFFFFVLVLKICRNIWAWFFCHCNYPFARKNSNIFLFVKLSLLLQIGKRKKICDIWFLIITKNHENNCQKINFA